MLRYFRIDKGNLILLLVFQNSVNIASVLAHCTDFQLPVIASRNVCELEHLMKVDPAYQTFPFAAWLEYPEIIGNFSWPSGVTLGKNAVQ